MINPNNDNNRLCEYYSYFDDLYGDNVVILSHADASKEFKKRYQLMLRPSNFDSKAKILLYLLIQSDRYSSLSCQDMTDILQFSKSTVWRARNTEYIKKNHIKKQRGRPPKLSLAIVDELLQVAKSERDKGTPLSLKWFQSKVKELSLGNIEVSLSCICRILKKRGWRKLEAQAHHPLQYSLKESVVIQTFLNSIQQYMEDHNLKRENMHIMDESGIYSNMIPKYTYCYPGEKTGYVKTTMLPQRDTIITTLSGNGDGFLYYVPHTKSQNIVNDQHQILHYPGRKGVGNKEIRQWAESFLNYCKDGDILLLDNLNAHKDSVFINILSKKNIQIFYFPVRAASILSVLDNCFFGSFKNILRQVIFKGPEDKEMKIKETFTNIINAKMATPHFDHCKYKFAADDKPVDNPRCITTTIEPPESYITKDQNNCKSILPKCFQTKVPVLK